MRARPPTAPSWCRSWTSLLLGLGFGVPAAIGTVYFARHGSVWTFLGFPTHGEGPFTAVGIPDSAPLQIGFVVMCAAEVAVGVLMWRGHRAGAQLSIALLPFELAYWIGFALPFGPVLGVLRRGDHRRMGPLVQHQPDHAPTPTPITRGSRSRILCTQPRYRRSGTPVSGVRMLIRSACRRS